MVTEKDIEQFNYIQDYVDKQFRKSVKVVVLSAIVVWVCVAGGCWLMLVN
jgi:ferritin